MPPAAVKIRRVTGLSQGTATATGCREMAGTAVPAGPCTVRPVWVRIVPDRTCNRSVLGRGWAERLTGSGGSWCSETFARTDTYRAAGTANRH